ncbi:MAG: 2-oxoacid:acceptor oxidoreductase family protein [Microgenomates group bacterium]
MSPVTTVKITGPAGAGIKSSGLLFSNMLLAHGQNLRDYSEYPSLVRGGHNTYQVSFSPGEVLAPHYQVDILLSLLPNHWQMHSSELVDGSLVFGEDGKNILPLANLSKEFGSHLYSNTIGLGVMVFILGLDKTICQKIVAANYGADSPNNPAFLSGYTYAENNFMNLKLNNLDLIKNLKLKIKNFLYEGNEAFGWGFIAGGGTFYSAYPMTPSSGALHFLAAKQAEYKINVIHAEDEIACASLAAGATFAGARAATGTSGGGFALMNETVSFCGAAELGTLFYLVSRPGPATGLPTWTGQGDLLYAVHSGHGEFTKIVLAPSTQAETFEFAYTALNLAAHFNVPTILLSDKFIAESGSSLPDLSVQKVPIIKSTKAVPGTVGSEYMANSYEHDESGFSTEDALVIKKMVEKRIALSQQISLVAPKSVLSGSVSAQGLIVTWGSPTPVIQEALRLSGSTDYALLQIRTVCPLDPELESIINKYKNIIVVENNATSQLTQLLKSHFNFNPTKTILKYDGRPFFPEEIINLLNIR